MRFRYTIYIQGYTQRLWIYKDILLVVNKKGYIDLFDNIIYHLTPKLSILVQKKAQLHPKIYFLVLLICSNILRK